MSPPRARQRRTRVRTDENYNSAGLVPEKGVESMDSPTSTDRIAELERKIAELQRQVEASGAAVGGPAPTPHPSDGAADKDINYYSWCAAAAGALPTPLLDLAAVTAVQLRLVKRLAHLYERDFDDESGKSLVAALTGAMAPAFLGQGGAKLAVRMLPVVGGAVGLVTLPAFNYGSTRVVGHYFKGYFKNPATGKHQIAGVADAIRSQVKSATAAA
jgi:uncharacterized protein (DUF697 family)